MKFGSHWFGKFGMGYHSGESNDCSFGLKIMVTIKPEFLGAYTPNKTLSVKLVGYILWWWGDIWFSIAEWRKNG